MSILQLFDRSMQILIGTFHTLVQTICSGNTPTPLPLESSASCNLEIGCVVRPNQHSLDCWNASHLNCSSGSWFGIEVWSLRTIQRLSVQTTRQSLPCSRGQTLAVWVREGDRNKLLLVHGNKRLLQHVVGTSPKITGSKSTCTSMKLQAKAECSKPFKKIVIILISHWARKQRRGN